MAMMESRSCRCRSRVKSCVDARCSWQGTHHPKHYNISRIEIIFFKIYFILENSWSVPGLEPPDGNPFHALIGVHPEEEEKESDEEEEDLEEDMEEEEEDGDEEIHVT